MIALVVHFLSCACDVNKKLLIDSACNCYRSSLKHCCRHTQENPFNFFVKFVYFWDKDVNFDGVYFWLRKTYESLTKHNIETNKSCEMMTLVHALKSFRSNNPLIKNS